MRGDCQGDSPRLTGSIAEWFPLGQAEIALDESPETRALVEAVAARLREARRAQRLTLRALSEKTGLSEPFLSRLERGLVSTSIANLILITRTVGIDLGQLFQGVSGTTTTQHYALVRAAERRPPQEVPATGYTYQPMAVGWPGQRMDAYVLMVAAPGRGPGREYGWWKAPAPAARTRPRRLRRSSRTRRDG